MQNKYSESRRRTKVRRVAKFACSIKLKFIFYDFKRGSDRYEPIKTPFSLFYAVCAFFTSLLFNPSAVFEVDLLDEGNICKTA